MATRDPFGPPTRSDDLIRSINAYLGPSAPPAPKPEPTLPDLAPPPAPGAAAAGPLPIDPAALLRDLDALTPSTGPATPSEPSNAEAGNLLKALDSLPEPTSAQRMRRTVRGYEPPTRATMALERGGFRAMESFAASAAALGMDPDFAAETIARQRERLLASKPPPELERFLTEETWESFAAAPLTITSTLIAESFGTFAAVLGASAGAASVGPAGPIVVTGMGSTAVEAGGKILDEFQKRGVDLTDPKQIAEAFRNPKLMAEVRELAILKGLPIGLFDALSMGIAGRLFAPGRKVGGRLVGGLAEIGGQAVLGGTGELSGQLAAGEEISRAAIASEMIAEAGMGPVEIATATMARGEPAIPDIGVDREAARQAAIESLQPRRPRPGAAGAAPFTGRAVEVPAEFGTTLAPPQPVARERAAPVGRAAPAPEAAPGPSVGPETAPAPHAPVLSVDPAPSIEPVSVEIDDATNAVTVHEGGRTMVYRGRNGRPFRDRADAEAFAREKTGIEPAGVITTPAPEIEPEPEAALSEGRRSRPALQEPPLTGAAAEAIDRFIGLSVRDARAGAEFGAFNEGRLERIFALDAGPEEQALRAEIEAAIEPVRRQLRERYGSHVRLYRSQRPVAADAAPRNVLSYTDDPRFARFHAGLAPRPRQYPAIDPVAAREELDRAGEVRVGRYIIRRETDPNILAKFPDAVVTYDRNPEIGDVGGDVTLDAELETLQRSRDDDAAAVAPREAQLQARLVPIDDIVWFTDRMNQREFIVKSPVPAPEIELPLAHERYFDLTPDTVEIPIESLRPIRARPKGIANAKPRMRAAYEGQGPRRAPIDVRAEADGSYTILDGNSTYAVAAEAGWPTMPVRVVETAEPAAEAEPPAALPPPPPPRAPEAGGPPRLGDNAADVVKRWHDAAMRRLPEVPARILGTREDVQLRPQDFVALAHTQAINARIVDDPLPNRGAYTFDAQGRLSITEPPSRKGPASIRPATLAEEQHLFDAIERGAVQIQSEPYTGTGTTDWRRDDLTDYVLHQATGHRLAEGVQPIQAVTPIRSSVSAEAGGALSTDAMSILEGTQPPAVHSSVRPPPSGVSTILTMAPSTLEGSTRTFGDFELGTIEPTSKRRIWQGSADFNALLDHAEQILPTFTDMLSAVAETIPGVTVHGTRVKTRAGMMEKINQGRPAQTIADYLGGRVLAETPEALAQAVEAVPQAAGPVQPLDVENFLDTPKWGYRAVHMQMPIGDGTSVEIQFVPAPIEPVHEQAHTLYDKWKRKTEITPAERAEFERDKAASEKIFEDALRGTPWESLLPTTRTKTRKTATKAKAPKAAVKPSAAGARIAERLRSGADSLQRQIDEKRNPATAGQRLTPRRQRIMEGMRKDADLLADIQAKMRQLADLHEAGAVPPALAKVTTRAAIERLRDTREWPTVSRDTPQNSWWREEAPKRQAALKKDGITNAREFTAAKEALAAVGTFELSAEELNQRERARIRGELVGVKIPGFFETPTEVALRMVEAADLKPGEAILEPSAGAGSIARQIRANLPDGATLTAIEINPKLAEILNRQGIEATNGDFLQHVGGPYDKILMNPPFERMQDAFHVQHAYDMLKPGGRLISIMSPHGFQATDSKSVAWREWMAERERQGDTIEVEDLPSGTFEQTGVASKMVSIDKAPADGAVEGTIAAEGESVYTPAGREIKVAYEVVELENLIPSHRDDMTPNPDFPARFQPRQRERAASQKQIADIASNLRPPLLGRSATTAEGAPIVDNGGLVESGNARVLALRRARGMRTWNAYKSWLRGEGFNIDGFAEPVLVRRRLSTLTEADRAAYIRESNERTTASMGEAEQAAVDAASITPAVLNAYKGGEINGAANREFVRAFVSTVLPSAEAAQAQTATGVLSQAGIRRIENALFAKAYQDADLLAALREDTDANWVAIGKAMVHAAPAWARMRADVEIGGVKPEFDITANLLEALRLVRRQRAERIKLAELVKQDDMISGQVDPLTIGFLRVMFRNEELTRPRAGPAVADMLARYTVEVDRQSGDQLFGADVGPGQALDAVIGREGDLFGEPVSAMAAPGRRAAGPRRAQPRGRAVVPLAAVQPRTSPHGPGSRWIGMRREGATGEALETPIRREEIIGELTKHFGVPVYQGRIRSPGVEGFYRKRIEEIRARNHSDLEVVAHEMAHLIDDRTPEIRKQFRSRPFAADLKAVSYDMESASEGWAEFIRLWMTQRGEAARRAPVVHAWWESFLARPDNAALAGVLNRARDKMDAWFEQDPLTRARSKIGTPPNLNTLTEGMRGGRFQQASVDDLHAIARAETQLYGEIRDGGMYQVARNTRGALSIVLGAVQYGAPTWKQGRIYFQDLDGHTDRLIRRNRRGGFDVVDNPEYKAAGLAEIMGRVERNKLDDWGLYMIGRSAEELAGQRRENLFSRHEIAAMKALETETFREMGEAYQRYNRQLLDFAEQGGVLNPEARAKFRRDFYMPFYRVASGDETVRASTKGGRTPGHMQVTRQLKGGTANIGDPIENIIHNTRILIESAIYNRARLKVVDDILKTQDVRGGARFLARIPPTSEKVAVLRESARQGFIAALKQNYGAAEMAAALKRLRAGEIGEAEMADIATKIGEEREAMVEQAEEIFAEMPDFMHMWLHNRAPKGMGVIAVMRAGKPEFYEMVGDEGALLFRAFESLPRHGRAPNGFIDILNGFRRLKQFAITHTGTFIARNLARDPMHAWAFSKYGHKPYLDAARGLLSRMRRDPIYRDYLAAQAGFSTHYEQEASLTGKNRFYRDIKIPNGGIIGVTLSPLRFIDRLSTATEEATRIGEYKRAVERHGASQAAAGYAAADITTDFRMNGDAATFQTIYRMFEFVHAGAEGMYRAYRGMLTNQAGNRSSVAMRMALLAAGSALLWAWNKGNPLYDERPEWEKDTHWHFFIPNARYFEWLAEHGDFAGGDWWPDTAEETRDLVYGPFLLPKPWEVGMVGGTLVEQALNGAVAAIEQDWGKARRAARGVKRAIFDMFRTPTVPTIAGPVFEVAVNWDFFRDRPVVPKALDDQPPGLEYTAYTSRFLRDIGRRSFETFSEDEWLQISPIVTEHLIYGYIAGLGAGAVMLADRAFYDDIPGLRWEQVPVARAFYKPSAPSSSYVEQFYDRLEATEHVHRGWLRLSREDRQSHADRLKESERFVANAHLMPVRQTLGTLTRLASEIAFASTADQVHDLAKTVSKLPHWSARDRVAKLRGGKYWNDMPNLKFQLIEIVTRNRNEIAQIAIEDGDQRLKELRSGLDELTRPMERMR